MVTHSAMVEVTVCICILWMLMFTIRLGARDPTFILLVVAKQVQFAAVIHTKALETSIVLVEIETKTNANMQEYHLVASKGRPVRPPW